MYKNK